MCSHVITGNTLYATLFPLSDSAKLSPFLNRLSIKLARDFAIRDEFTLDEDSLKKALRPGLRTAAFRRANRPELSTHRSWNKRWAT